MPEPHLSLGDRVVAIDNRGRRFYFTLKEGSALQTHLGEVAHTEIAGLEEGSVVTSSKGAQFVIFRPTMSESVVRMPRGAAVIYPKDAAAIIQAADIAPGDVVLEVGAGSGSLTSYLLRAVGSEGEVHSFEARDDFAKVAEKNVRERFASSAGRSATNLLENWFLQVQQIGPESQLPRANAAVLDLLKPWQLLPAFAKAVVPGGHIAIYVTTTTQMSEAVEALRNSGDWYEPEAIEVSSRPWQVLGLSVRPAHANVSHTGFIVSARRMANGHQAPKRKRRINKMAYEETSDQQT